MQQAEALRGKKVALEVSAQDAPVLRERGKDFLEALKGKTIKPDDQVIFGQVLLRVEGTKPKGAVIIGNDTKVKISITNQQLRQSCAACSQEQPPGQVVCVSCGAELPVIKV